MSMTREEAIKRIQHHMVVHHIGEPPHIYIKEALDMAIDALREQEEREKQPQPLTMAELRNMNGETVYCEDVNADVKIHAYEVGLIYVRYKDHFEDALFRAKDVTLYRHKPKEGET